ncbi:DUF3857 domain-containing protein [Aquabacterium sp.]|uniref:DUF3857 domain-containing protein n=1 Tax=Aquabacterium sp. TaxID=1872578 RepID=UPI0037840D21
MKRWRWGWMGLWLACWLGTAWAEAPKAARAAPAVAATPKARAPGANRPPAAARPQGEASAAADAAAGFQIAPVPDWVQPVPVDASIALPSAPVQVLVIDHQTRLGPAGAQQFLRSVRQINEPSGLVEASQLQVSFDPQYQQLVLHQVTVWRGDQRIDKLERRHVRLYQRETQLERLMLDGRMTASIVLDDVRVGDRIEWSLSVIGINPVFDGRFVDVDLAAGRGGPLGLYRYRLLAPEGRSIQHRFADGAFEVQTGLQGGLRETVFTRRNVAQFVHDPQAPPWLWLADALQLSEFADWADVARWAEALFKDALRSDGEVLARAAEIRERAATPAERLRLALDLVQTEVRYFGIEIGASSHRPAPAARVLQQRFGDCKDKVALLVSLLRALDIDATPVLVSNGLRRGAAQMLPSPLAFDHAIARVQLEGQTLWLDGTRSQQTGPAALRQSHGLGEGLPASAATSALAPLPGTDDELRVDGVDTLRFGKLGEPGSLQARHVFHGEMAEFLRSVLASRPREEFDRQISADYLRIYNGAQLDGPVEVAPDNEHNAVAVTVRLKLPNYWRLNDKALLTGELPLNSLITAIRLPDQAPRTRPLYIGRPGIYRQAVVAEFAEDVFAKDVRERFDENNSFFDLRAQLDGTRRSMRLEAEVRQLGDAIEPADWSRYRELLNKVAPRLVLSLFISPIEPGRARQVGDQIKDIVAQIQRGTAGGATPQLAAQVIELVTRAQLEGDRLSPALRAQVQQLRAPALDTLGRLPEGAEAYRAALAFKPDNADALAGLAGNALRQGDDAAALERANQALKIAPRHLAARQVHAFASYYLENYAATRDDLQELLKSRGSELGRSQVPLWLYLATRRLGGDGVAAMAAAGSGGGSSSGAEGSSAWPAPLLQFYEGKLDFDAVLARAGSEAALKKLRETEAYFYAAQKALLDGDAAQARRYWQKAVALGAVETKEYTLAQRELKRLDSR